MKILITGASGQIGRELATAARHHHEVLTPGRATLDLANEHSIREFIHANKPELIFNPAAYTAVDRAEDEAAVADQVNVRAVEIIAEESAKLGAAIVHYSTDYVFDGLKVGPYVEEDDPHPQNVYGRTKLDGERALAQSGVPHLILRTSWVYGLHGRNFLRTMIRAASEGRPLRVVDDQIGTPNWARILATATLDALAPGFGSNKPIAHYVERFGGVYHISCEGFCSWYDFACAIFSEENGLGLAPSLIPISSAKYPTRAVRPRNSSLSAAKFTSTFGVELPHWRNGLQACIRSGTVDV